MQATCVAISIVPGNRRVDHIYQADKTSLQRNHLRISYQMALSRYRSLVGLERISWVTWGITIVTVAIWCFTASQAAVGAGAHTLLAIITDIAQNAITVQDKDNNALADVLLTYGAKDNGLILQGQYWRFVMPIFLHVNLLHVGLNMLNFVVLGVFLERLLGHARLLLIYLITGIISIITSCIFTPQDISVGASGAIFGLVGAYCMFVLLHRHAFRNGGVPALLWLVFIIGLNLGIGLFIPNVDNYAHIGGLLAGFLLGWWFTPLYKPALSPSSAEDTAFVDMHSLARRWPLALVTVVGTFVLAACVVHYMGR